MCTRNERAVVMWDAWKRQERTRQLRSGMLSRDETEPATG